MSNELTTRVAAELALALTESCCGTALRKRILSDRIPLATDVAIKHLRPWVPTGLMKWAVRAQVRESPRAYARRAIRCLIARCAQAGLACELSARNAEDVGMRDGHGSTLAKGYAVGLVSRIERAIDRQTEAEEAE